VAVRADVTDRHAAIQLVQDVIAKFGGIDVLAKCALEIDVGPLDALDTGKYQRAFRGVFLRCLPSRSWRRCHEELAWIASARQSPFTSADPGRTAKAIVEVARFGDVERMVTSSSFLQARLHALWPSLSIASNALIDKQLVPPSLLDARGLPRVSKETIVSPSEREASSAPDRPRDSGRRARYLQPGAREYGSRRQAPSSAAIHGAGHLSVVARRVMRARAAWHVQECRSSMQILAYSFDHACEFIDITLAKFSVAGSSISTLRTGV